jgi:hypothetical protein
LSDFARCAGRAVLALALALIALPAAGRGPYDDWDENGVSYDDRRIVGWATGYLDYWHPAASGGAYNSNPGEAVTVENAVAGAPESASNDPTTHYVSLGNGGHVTLVFDRKIRDLDGPDLAVWENGSPDYTFREPWGEWFFAELMFVEVATTYHASDGSYWARFPTSYLASAPVHDWNNPAAVPPEYNTMDVTYVDGFAGKHANNTVYGEWGTAFDLGDLAGDANVVAGRVDLDDINCVRVVDVVGNGSTTDSAGDPVYDPYPSEFGVGGADLKGVAVLVQWGPGDFDHNAVVGLGDFSIFAGKYGHIRDQAGWNPECDMDASGVVGLGDFSLFAGLYGTTYSYAGVSAGGATVPEPGLVVAAALAAAALVGRLRRRG